MQQVELSDQKFEYRGTSTKTAFSGLSGPTEFHYEEQNLSVGKQWSETR